MIEYEAFRKATQRLMKQGKELPGGVAMQAALGAADLFGKIVSKTPYNIKGTSYEFSGNAQQSWQCFVNPGEARDILEVFVIGGGENRERTGSAPISYHDARSEALMNIGEVEEGDRILISSDIIYMHKLEDGHSRQAPDGFIRLAIVDAESQIAKKVGRHLRKITGSK